MSAVTPIDDHNLTVRRLMRRRQKEQYFKASDELQPTGIIL